MPSALQSAKNSQKKKQQKRPGFLFLVCPDAGLLRQEIHSRLQEDTQDWQKHVFWADEELPEKFWTTLTLDGLLPAGNAVILRKAENMQASFWKDLHPVLAKFRSKIWPFFCLEKEWSKGKPSIPAALSKQKYWQVAREKGWIWQSPGLSRAGLRDYLHSWAKSRGFQLQEQFVSQALQILPLDAGQLQSELQKLELWAWDKKELQPADLGQVSLQGSTDIFGFLQGLQSKGAELRVWQEVLRYQLQGNTDQIMLLLRLLLREARIMWQLLQGEQPSGPLPGRIKAQKQGLAAKLGEAGLARLWEVLLQTETDIKSGNISQDQAWEILSSKLLRIFP
ncbi:MAG: DNA polymerase III subunit delta [Desulfohalobiaceae bacterium]